MLTEAQHALNAIAIAMDEINASGQLGNAQLSLVTADDSPYGFWCRFCSPLID